MNTSASPAAAPLIAIVDDDIQVGKSLTRLLVMMGFRAQFHESGAGFLFSLGARQPECVLVDAQMPNMEGLQLMECINAMKMKLPMILATGSHDESLWARAKELGAEGLLLKPYCVDDIMIKVNQAMGCPGFVPRRCPWPCPAIGKAVWNCAFAGFTKQARNYLNLHPGPHSGAFLSSLANTAEPSSKTASLARLFQSHKAKEKPEAAPTAA